MTLGHEQNGISTCSKVFNRGHVATPLGYSKKIGVRPTTNQAVF